MSRAARDWLPDTALVESELIDRLDSAVAEWSAKWFGDRPMQRLGRAGISPSAGERAWRRFAPGVWLDWQASTALALARHALALGGNLPRAGAADERLLSHYAERIGQELAARLAETLRPRGDCDTDASPAAGIDLKLQGSDGIPTVRLFIAAHAVVALRKRLCRPWRAPEASSQPLSQALATCPVVFEASLGIAGMTALDLRNIAPGDVVVLERGTTDPVLLRACESGTIIAGARLVREDGELQLKAC